MIGSLFQMLFRCPHRRLTRPITRVSKQGVPGGETTVVCLDCGQQFAYDWNHMRVGKPVEPSHDKSVLHPNMPGQGRTKVKYALLGSVIPFAVLAGRALFRRKGSGEDAPDTLAAGASPDRRISLYHQEAGAGFRVRDLIEHIENSGRNYIIEGGVDCALADHPRPRSLDYWLRENFAHNKETRQDTRDVIRQLLATGAFEESDDLRCPDTGERALGLRLKPAAQRQ